MRIGFPCMVRLKRIGHYKSVGATGKPFILEYEKFFCFYHQTGQIMAFFIFGARLFIRWR
jgi:hypothetical protein